MTENYTTHYAVENRAIFTLTSNFQVTQIVRR